MRAWIDLRRIDGSTIELQSDYGRMNADEELLARSHFAKALASFQDALDAHRRACDAPRVLHYELSNAGPFAVDEVPQ